jgi:cytoskeleton protein RodZ
MSAERVDQPVPDQHGIPGKTLAAQREAMGWTVEQVADQLKLAVRQVVALEEGDYANLPGPAVVRGFVRAYAKVVKLDAAPLVAQIALETPAAPDNSAAIRRDKPTSFSQVRFPTHGKRASKMPWVLIGAIVLVVGGAGAAWQLGLLPKLALPSMSPAATSTAPAATTADASVTVLPPPVQAQPQTGTDPAKPAEAHPPVISNPVPLISVPPPTTPSVPGAGASTPAAVSPAPVAPAGTTPPGTAGAPVQAPASAGAPNALIMTVREDSWIEVRQPKGPKLFSGLVKAGRVEAISVSGPITLIVGRPSAVEVTLRGQPVSLPVTAGGRVARVNLQ